MQRVIFVCHGNICRSVAAEYIARYLLTKRGLEGQFEILSRATSYEEIGNDIYPPMKSVLREMGIPFGRHEATRITREEYEKADFIFCMDSNNLRNLERIVGPLKPKVRLMSFYLPKEGEIEDPWYTGRFAFVAGQLLRCIDAFLDSETGNIPQKR